MSYYDDFLRLTNGGEEIYGRAFRSLEEICAEYEELCKNSFSSAGGLRRRNLCRPRFLQRYPQLYMERESLQCMLHDRECGTEARAAEGGKDMMQ